MNSKRKIAHISVVTKCFRAQRCDTGVRSFRELIQQNNASKIWVLKQQQYERT